MPMESVNGLEPVHIAVPPIGFGRPGATGISHGPERKMTAIDNIWISVIGALVMIGLQPTTARASI